MPLWRPMTDVEREENICVIATGCVACVSDTVTDWVAVEEDRGRKCKKHSFLRRSSVRSVGLTNFKAATTQERKETCFFCRRLLRLCLSFLLLLANAKTSSSYGKPDAFCTKLQLLWAFLNWRRIDKNNRPCLLKMQDFLSVLFDV